MRNIILVLNLIISISAFAQKETYVTEYEIKYEVDYQYYVEDETRSQEIMYLYTGNDGSVFLNHNKAKEEEIEERMHEMMRSGNINMNEAGYIHSRFKIDVYKGYIDNQLWIVTEIADREYTYQEPKVPLTWKISNETKIYEQYEVQKATTNFAGRNYIAWFSLEIPIADGPYVFSGLPGLIVELYDTEEHYIFSLLSVEKLNKPKTLDFNKKILLKNKVKEVEAKYLKMKKNSKVSLNDDEFEIKVTMGGRELSETEYNRIRRERAKKEINYIELK